jgi:chitin disaccharide deacetylase
MSPVVNDAVFELAAARRISSATMMANAPAVRQAALCVKRFPGCSFGVHLNLTKFEPVTRGAGSRLLLNGADQMSRAIERAPRSLARLRAVYEEMCAQIELVASLDVPISHLDSHHHIHTKPFFFLALKAAQRRYAIRKVRIAKNLYSRDQTCSRALRWKKRAYNRALRSMYRTQTTEAFTELLSFREPQPGPGSEYRTVELMVHPAHPSYSEEAVALNSDWFDELRRTATLISYDELGT